MLLHKAIVTVLGLGMAPFAPGTFGALGAVLFLYLFNFTNTPLPLGILLVLIGVLTLIGVWSTDKLYSEWGDDPSRVVIDEFIGILVSVVMLPLTSLNIWLAFVLFRFFDILKPLGIRYVDKNLKGGWGVMLDDVLAGVYTCICLHLINHFILS